MEIKPNDGIDDVKFGMTELEVMAILGAPDLILSDPDDEEQNTVYQYNRLKLRLTFYTSENNRLLYIRTTHPSAQLKGLTIMDQDIEQFIRAIDTSKKDWGIEFYFSFNVYFYEDWWLTLHEEYGRITHVEFGAKTIEPWENRFAKDV
jgi:hypothetical protein